MNLQGKTIISTRPESSDDSFKKYLLASGAKVIDMPLISIRLAPHSEEFIEIFENINKFEWVIFTSKNGVECFFEFAKIYRIHPENFNNIKFCTFGGKTTKSLLENGYHPYFHTKGLSSEDFLIEFLNNNNVYDDNILLALGDLARSTLEIGFASIANVTRINVYSTVPIETIDDDLIEIIRYDDYDLIAFTSPSGFDNFIKIIMQNNIRNPLKIAAIGETTEKAILKHGYTPLLVSSHPDGETFAREIEIFLSKHSNIKIK